MANTNKEKLFAQFPPVPTEKWEEVITADLKGADYERKLVWRTEEGFKVRPYYRAEDLEGIEFLSGESGEFPFVRGTHKSNRWRVHQTLCAADPAQANAQARKLLASGVDSLGFRLGADFAPESLDTLLAGIDLASAEVTFCGEGAGKVAEPMLDKAAREGIAPEQVRLNFVIDPLIEQLSLRGAFGCCPDGGECFDRLAALVAKAAPFKHVRVVGVDGQEFHNAGSTIVQELAFTLAAGHEYLVQLIERGVKVEQAAKKIRFTMAVSSNYFMEIAKLRAARMLWANIVKAYDPKCPCASKMTVHAATSRWNQTVYDPYVNMLRGTTEAMSASLGGVHSLEVVPFDAAFESPTDFSRRIARNVQLLLKHESHFDQVVDPAGGSYYIENLTRSIAAEAWKLFREVEQKGGYTAAFRSGFIVEQVEASAAAKDRNIATRRQILLGANQYPNFNEVAGEEVTPAAVAREAAQGNCLKPYRGAMAFEQMRLQVDRSGRNPMAFMLTCGTLSMARARSQFSCNFFACAGIRVQDNTFFHSVEEGVQAALDARADIVVVCAADDDYITVAPRIKELLAGRAILVVAGAPASAPELEAQGISNFINVKSNVLETLRYYLNELGIK